ncbi:MAG: NUDIX hydrolase [Leptolyngbya sp. PLA3]|nr:MAG: NUDIX hydrolase [Cyanobacteria bacterium CYA]MCE7967554.1 NUDIX hydrolase [Leptolyngbya sp. PL-A3]
MSGADQQPLRPWIPGTRRVLATTRIFTLEEQSWDCPTDPSRSGRFAVINSPDWVNVFALTPDDQLVLVEQFRFGTGTLSIEIPGGIVDHAELPAATAARELLEETGYAGSEPVPLGAISANAAILNNRVHTYVITDAHPVGAQALDENEQIRVLKVPVEDAMVMAADGRIHHSIVVAAFTLFQRWYFDRCPH